MLWQYIGSLPARSQRSRDNKAISFGRRKEVVARLLSATNVRQLQVEFNFVLDVDEEIKEALTHYGTPDPVATGGNLERAAKDVLSARVGFLAQCGRHPLQIAFRLRGRCEKSAVTSQNDWTPDEREAHLANECQGKLAKPRDAVSRRFGRQAFVYTRFPAAETPPAGRRRSGSQPSQRFENNRACPIGMRPRRRSPGNAIDCCTRLRAFVH